MKELILITGSTEEKRFEMAMSLANNNKGTTRVAELIESIKPLAYLSETVVLKEGCFFDKKKIINQYNEINKECLIVVTNEIVDPSDFLEVEGFIPIELFSKENLTKELKSL